VIYAHDTEVALAVAAALVNTRRGDVEALGDRAGLAAFLREHPFTGRIDGDDAELAGVLAVRDRIRQVFHAPDRDSAVMLVNALLAGSQAHPYLARHDDWDWHLHVTDPQAPLPDRIAAESAMAFADLVRADALGRLRHCAAPDCSAVLVDLSRNRSKRYCDTGNCGNRLHVAAYRARHAGVQVSR
jgi:predicted RNA-binding Zn ribbon-like protein